MFLQTYMILKEKKAIALSKNFCEERSKKYTIDPHSFFGRITAEERLNTTIQTLSLSFEVILSLRLLNINPIWVRQKCFYYLWINKSKKYTDYRQLTERDKRCSFKPFRGVASICSFA